MGDTKTAAYHLGSKLNVSFIFDEINQILLSFENSDHAGIVGKSLDYHSVWTMKLVVFLLDRFLVHRVVD